MNKIVTQIIFAILITLTSHAFADNKATIAIQLQPVSSSDNDQLTATAFGISLAHWYEKSGEIESLKSGIVKPSHKALLHAFRSQIQIWRELNEKNKIENHYMQQLLRVDNAGYLSEYIWRYHRKKWWPNIEVPNKSEQFTSWAKSNLGHHTPRMEARLNVKK